MFYQTSQFIVEPTF